MHHWFQTVMFCPHLINLISVDVFLTSCLSVVWSLHSTERERGRTPGGNEQENFLLSNSTWLKRSHMDVC